MQHIEEDGRYVSKWSDLEIRLNRLGAWCEVEIRKALEGTLIAAMPITRCSAAEAIRW